MKIFSYIQLTVCIDAMRNVWEKKTKEKSNF